MFYRHWESSHRRCGCARCTTRWLMGPAMVLTTGILFLLHSMNIADLEPHLARMDSRGRRCKAAAEQRLIGRTRWPAASGTARSRASDATANFRLRNRLPLPGRCIMSSSTPNLAPPQPPAATLHSATPAPPFFRWTVRADRARPGFPAGQSAHAVVDAAWGLYSPTTGRHC